MRLRAFFCVVLAFLRIQGSLADWESSGKNLSWIYDIKNEVTTQNQTYKLNPETGAFRYHFDVSIVDSYKFETQSNDAVTMGCYGWKDAAEKWHPMNYVADSHGWRTVRDISKPIDVYPTDAEHTTRTFLDNLPQCLAFTIDSAPLKVFVFTNREPTPPPSPIKLHDDHIPHGSEHVHRVFETPPRHGPPGPTVITQFGGPPGGLEIPGPIEPFSFTSRFGGSPLTKPSDGRPPYKGTALKGPPGSPGIGIPPTQQKIQPAQLPHGGTTTAGGPPGLPLTGGPISNRLGGAPGSRPLAIGEIPTQSPFEDHIPHASTQSSLLHLGGSPPLRPEGPTVIISAEPLGLPSRPLDTPPIALGEAPTTSLGSPPTVFGETYRPLSYQETIPTSSPPIVQGKPTILPPRPSYEGTTTASPRGSPPIAVSQPFTQTTRPQFEVTSSGSPSEAPFIGSGPKKKGEISTQSYDFRIPQGDQKPIKPSSGSPISTPIVHGGSTSKRPGSQPGSPPSPLSGTIKQQTGPLTPNLIVSGDNASGRPGGPLGSPPSLLGGPIQAIGPLTPNLIVSGDYTSERPGGPSGAGPPPLGGPTKQTIGPLTPDLIVSGDYSSKRPGGPSGAAPPPLDGPIKQTIGPLTPDLVVPGDYTSERPGGLSAAGPPPLGGPTKQTIGTLIPNLILSGDYSSKRPGGPSGAAPLPFGGPIKQTIGPLTPDLVVPGDYTSERPGGPSGAAPLPFGGPIKQTIGPLTPDLIVPGDYTSERPGGLSVAAPPPLDGSTKQTSGPLTPNLIISGDYSSKRPGGPSGAAPPPFGGPGKQTIGPLTPDLIVSGDYSSKRPGGPSGAAPLPFGGPIKQTIGPLTPDLVLPGDYSSERPSGPSGTAPPPFGGPIKQTVGPLTPNLIASGGYTSKRPGGPSGSLPSPFGGPSKQAIGPLTPNIIVSGGYSSKKPSSSLGSLPPSSNYAGTTPSSSQVISSQPPRRTSFEGFPSTISTPYQGSTIVGLPESSPIDSDTPPSRIPGDESTIELGVPPTLTSFEDSTSPIQPGSPTLISSGRPTSPSSSGGRTPASPSRPGTIISDGTPDSLTGSSIELSTPRPYGVTSISVTPRPSTIVSESPFLSKTGGSPSLPSVEHSRQPPSLPSDSFGTTPSPPYTSTPPAHKPSSHVFIPGTLPSSIPGIPTGSPPTYAFSTTPESPPRSTLLLDIPPSKRPFEGTTPALLRPFDSTSIGSTHAPKFEIPPGSTPVITYIPPPTAFSHSATETPHYLTPPKKNGQYCMCSCPRV